jgi:glycine betaine/proline transport system permease protein
LKGIQQLQIDVGFEAGISIVILAIFLDRVTQSLSHSK